MIINLRSRRSSNIKQKRVFNRVLNKNVQPRVTTREGATDWKSRAAYHGIDEQNRSIFLKIGNQVRKKIKHFPGFGKYPRHLVVGYFYCDKDSQCSKNY